MLSLRSSTASYDVHALFDKRRSPEQERVEQLVQKLERSVRRAFLAFVEAVQSPAVMREVAELLGRNDVEGALRIVDRYIVRMAPVLATVFTEAATDETAAIAAQLARVMPLAAVSFDPTYPRAAELMRQARLEFVRYFTDTQRAAVREALADALMSGKGPAAASRAFRDAIGLTPSQDAAARNYRRLLTEGSREALERDIRDRRFDPTVRRAAASGEPLSAKQIDTMEAAYRRRYIAYRAETIARDQTGDVVSAARQEALEQIVDDVGIADDMVEREWRWTKDKRTRDTHRNMHTAVVRGTKTPFITGGGVPMMRPHDPSAPAKERVQCRCLQVIRIRKREAT